MAVTPINFSRVSHNLRTLSLLDSLRRNTMSLFAEQNRLATGNRLNAPSDDPVLAGRALTLTEILDRQDQILANAQHASAFINATDNAMTEVSELATQAKSIASEMVNTVVLPDERAAKAEIVSSIIDQLVAIGNRTYNGVQLFGGRSVLAPPFSRESGGVIYRGDGSDLHTDVGAAAAAAYNLSGDNLFGMTTGRTSGYRNLEPAPLAATRLADLSGAAGLGVRLGRIQVVSDGGAIAFTVDLTGSDTLGDVVDRINAAATAAGLGPIAGFGGVGLVLDNGSGGAAALEVREVGNGTTASDLGLLSASTTGIITGENLHARVTGTTPLAALAHGAGVSLASPIRITNGELNATIDLSAAQTVQDVLNAINLAGVGAQAVISADGDGIDVINLLSGQEMRISDVAGGTSADSLGIRTLHAGLPVSELNHGEGLRTVAGKSDLRVVAKNGAGFEVSLSGATTVQDVLNAINAAATAAGVAVTASLNPDGPGLRLDDATGGTGDLYVERLNGSYAIEDLGFVGRRSAPGATYLVGDDPAGVRPSSIFSALIDLENALRADDTTAINRAGQELERYLPQLIRVRGIVGARARVLNERVTFTEDAVQATRTLLSEVKDLDYTEAITKFQQAQTALQANLMTGSRLLQMSLLDFLG